MGQQDEGEGKGSRLRLGALGVTVSAAIASLPTAATADFQNQQSQAEQFDQNHRSAEQSPKTNHPIIIVDAADETKQGSKPAKNAAADDPRAPTKAHDDPPWRQNYYWWRNAWGNW